MSAEDSDLNLDNTFFQASEGSNSFIPFLQSSDNKSDMRKELCPVVSPKLGKMILKFSTVTFKLMVFNVFLNKIINFNY